jgi:hypothetical protein
MGFFSRLFRKRVDPDGQAEFLQWLTDRGADPLTATLVNALATSPEDFRAAYESRRPRPPFDRRAGIREMNDEDLCGVANLTHGLLLVGACPNGDPIAVDIADDPGSVWYVSHEEMHSEPLRSVSIRVAANLADWATALMENTENFAIDYFSAKRMGWTAPPASDSG